MRRDELLDELRRQLAAGALRPAEVQQLLDLASGEDDASGATLAARLSVVLYYIGGGVVFLGMVFLIAQEWQRFGSALKIFVTLGSGIAAFVVGVLLSPQQKLGVAGPAFFLIAAMLLPAGMFVAYDEAGIDAGSLATQIQVSGVLSVVFVAAYLVFRRNVLLTFGIVFCTWFLLVLTNRLLGGAPVFDEYSFNAYRVLFAGLSYMFLGHAFADSEREVLSGWLYGIGVLGVLGAGLALGEWKPHQNAFWEAIYPGIVFGVLFLSARLRSKTFLVFGSLALGTYLTKITAEYFSDSLGWAFSLVLVGFMLMGVAYLAVRIKRGYMTE